MVKPDVRQDYYADLELPNTASIDDIRKAYRKLALQYHPDRNAGREVECVPKFQAIQAAHEVLGDPTLKAKYDQDRRKAGLRPTTKPGSNAPGNPYTASSNYPPPPRRTQPGSWQRPTPTASAAPSGADRFANFARPNNSSPRKDTNTDRAQQFRAWQRVYNGAERPRNNYDRGSPSPQPSPSTARPRSQRQDTKMPSEEQIRAGMNYRSVPGNNRGDGDRRQSARNAFGQAEQSDEPGVKRSNTFKTPRKPAGFDPSAPGSDERPAPAAGNHYGHRHRSEDLGTPVNGAAFPPPPPGPPPTQPSSRRPSVDPSTTSQNANSSGDSDDNVPYYAKESRMSTPYSAFSGEKTKFSSDSLRRSASTRDTTKLQADKNSGSRARSTSPLGRQRADRDYTANGTQGHSQRQGLDETPAQPTDASQQRSNPTQSNAGLAEEPVPVDRPRKKAVPRIRRYNSNATSSTQAASNGAADGVQPESDNPGMQQRRSSQNMYATPHFFTIPQSRYFDRAQWVADAFGVRSASDQWQRTPHVPRWAIPSSVCPRPPSERRGTFSKRSPQSECAPSGSSGKSSDSRASQPLPGSFKMALLHFRHLLKAAFGGLEVQLNEEYFLSLIADAEMGSLPEHDLLSFTFPIYADTFTSNVSKSRSEENISTNFSPDGWNGTFTGAPDISTPPATGQRSSPARRTGQRPIVRTPTAERSFTNTTPMSNMAPPPRPSDFGSTQYQSTQGSTPGEVKFSKSEWDKTIQGPSWKWPPPPPNPPPKVRDASKQSHTDDEPGRQQARDISADRSPSTGTKENPHVVEDGHHETLQARATQVEDDAMDIDSTPPPVHSQATSTKPVKEPRLYSVPPSTWRQQQGAEQQQNRTDSKGSGPDAASAASSLNTNLDDLARVEPLGQGAEGLSSFTDLKSTLPFESKASTSLPMHRLEPQQLEVPSVPKAPEAPHKLTKASWHGYCQPFGSYLQAFHAFNRAMLTHFEARERVAQTQMQAGMGWLEAAGDTVGQMAAPSGFGTYLKGVREDEHVREVWNVGRERHAEAVKEFEKIRERVRYLTDTNALLER